MFEQMKELLPKFPSSISIVQENLGDRFAGLYFREQKKISISSVLVEDYPNLVPMVLLHEGLHATGQYRVERLEKRYGELTENSISYRIEECIVEIASRIILLKKGMLNEYTEAFIDQGFKTYYNQFLKIPWREVVAAVQFYSDEDYSDYYVEAKMYFKETFGAKFSLGNE